MNFKFSLLALGVAAMSLSISAPAHAQNNNARNVQNPAAIVAATGPLVGIENTDLRWRMSLAQAKAAVPDKVLFEKIGEDGPRHYYQLSGLVYPGFGNKQNEWIAILMFGNDELLSFDLIPWRERAGANVIGDADLWEDFLSLASYRGRNFPEIKAPPLRAVSEIQTKNGDAARLGFQVQSYVWSARGAHYRQAAMQGSYRNNVGIARLQGRVSQPFAPLQLADNGTNRAAFARAIAVDYGLTPSIERALLADETLFRAPKPAHQGNAIGISLINWGMTPNEVRAAPLAPGARVENAKNGLLIRDFKLAPDSQNTWLLQLDFDKKGLSEFELRPQNELQTNARLGLFGDDQAADYQDELDNWLENTRSIKSDQWWQESREVNTRVKRHYRAQSGTGIGISSYGFGYYAYSYPTYSTYKQFLTWPVGIDFTIRDRAWTSRSNHYRQAQLLNAQRGPKINVIRLQGRRDDKAFKIGTGETVKTKNPKIVMREVYENYNVKPNSK